MELEAASRAFGITIVVVPTDAGVQPPTRHGHTDRLIALWYSGTHYDLLLREGEKAGYPVAMTSVQAFGEKTGWRGGGAERLTIYTAPSAGDRRASSSARSNIRTLKRKPSNESVALTLFSLWGGGQAEQAGSCGTHRQPTGDCSASRDYDNEEDTQAGIETGFENQIEYEGVPWSRTGVAAAL